MLGVFAYAHTFRLTALTSEQDALANSFIHLFTVKFTAKAVSLVNATAHLTDAFQVQKNTHR